MSNNDLISREALKKAILGHCRSEIEAINHFWYDDTIITLIDKAPTVDIRNNGACEDCEYFNRPITSEPCRNCTLAYGSCFKEKEKVKDNRPRGELAEKLKDHIEGSVCKYCQMNKHCELCEISRVFQIITLTMQGQEGGAE